MVLTSDIWTRAVAAAGPVDGADVHTVVTVAKTFAIVLVVGFVALYVLFAAKMYLGRNWARIVLTVLAALAILTGVTAQASVTVNGVVYGASTSDSLRWVQAGVGVLALILMYLPASGAYFAAVRARRTYR